MTKNANILLQRAEPEILTKRDQRGFTLVEVLVAITVLSVGLVMVVQAMGRTHQAPRMSENMVIAAHIAEEKLTQLEIESRQGLSSFGGNSGKETFPGKSFEWSTASRPYEHRSIKDLSKLSMAAAEINWTEAQIPKSLRASTLILKRKSK